MLDNFKSRLRSASERARHRRQYAALLKLDDHLLRDIGVRRDEIRSRMAG